MTLFGSLRPPPPAALPAAGWRPRAAVVGTAAAIMLAGTGAISSATAAVLHLRCTNAVSGTSWPLAIDIKRARVNSLPATITDQWISWRDPQAGFFDLERSTGQLQMHNASSTGGYFLHYQCQPG